MQKIDGADEGTVNEPPFAATTDSSPDDEGDYEDMKVLSFGLMDPCDWAATLSTRLLAATRKLREARNHYADPAQDVTHFTEAEALAAIRIGVGHYLAELHIMLHSMPILQSQPETLEALQFILAGVMDIDRGSAPEWLAVRATKSHPKRLANEAEWVPIVAALELLLLGTRISGIDAAAKQVRNRTGRKIGTIKDWHGKLYRRGQIERPVAWAKIKEELLQMQQMVRQFKVEDRAALIERRVGELLA
jgi:hypothetical protein